MGQKSSAAPFVVVQRLALQWRWGTEWRGRGARILLTAAPTPTARMEREYPCICSTVTLRSVGLEFFVSFSLRFVFPTTRLGPDSQFSDFLDGLGPAQIVGRQTLATPSMGKPTGMNKTLNELLCQFWYFRHLLLMKISQFVNNIQHSNWALMFPSAGKNWKCPDVECTVKDGQAFDIYLPVYCCRGCLCWYGWQRRAAWGGGNSGQRSDPKTGL